MTAQRQIQRLGIVCGTLILGMAISGAALADDQTCENKNVMTTATGELCPTLNAITSALPTTPGGLPCCRASKLTTNTTGHLSETAAQTANRIAGTRSTRAQSGSAPTNTRGKAARTRNRVARNFQPTAPALGTPPTTTLQPPPMTAGTQQNQPAVQLPKIAPAPQRVRLVSAEPNTTNDLHEIILIAAGSGAMGLIGGGHIGLLAARARRRRA